MNKILLQVKEHITSYVSTPEQLYRKKIKLYNY